ncbi:SLAM family member 9 isoform X1 [Gadus morhua]|uniref:SLAM family member 9-like n=2 Tax=Gadus morhua TaxID=8049 RepID=A0A8C5FJV9_GADMO|nr:SLAM family member 9-like isoform X1 [Gadus morhua]XP_030193837.1 SLAM family member 9-like isoform X1 [Gadus morhua]
MWLPLLFFQLLGVVGSNQQVLGFLGESVTLSPALDVTQRNISSIKWLILSNDTWIATYQGGITNTNHFWQYRGRLNLDISSGDLTIKNLIKKDAMKYVFEVGFQGDEEISRKFVLRVEQRLAQPRVTKHHGWSEDGSCTVTLLCSSPNASVNFTWSSTPLATILFEGFRANTAYLLASMRADQVVSFTCNTATALESTSDTLNVECVREPIPKPTPHPPHCVAFGYGVLLGSCLGILLAMITYILRERIEDCIYYLTGKRGRSS